MNLIIVAGLSEPPTETLPLRYVTMVAHDQLKLDCLIESVKEMKDVYFQYLLHKGLMDYVEQLVTPEEKEDGIRLDTELNYPLTIKVKAVTLNNVKEILGQLQTLSKF